MTIRLSASTLLLALLGHAQSTADSISPDRMRPLLQAMGLRLTEKSSDGSTAYEFPLNGHLVTLLGQASSIRLSACIEVPADPMKGNQWNREHFSTRAYLDEKGCASLGADANFGGRVTNDVIEEFLGEFCTGLTIYSRFVTELPPDSKIAPRKIDLPTSPLGPMAWSQSGRTTKIAPPTQDSVKAVAGLMKINQNISLKYDPDRWRQTAPASGGRLALARSSGDGHVLVIAERIAVPRGSVEDIALANAQQVDPNAKVVFRQQRRINGADVRFLKIEADVNAVPMVYWGGFYGGEYGTVQVVTYTAKALVREQEKDFMDLLNGITVSK